VLAALALVVSGSALALAHLQEASDLVETAYGAALGVKIALVAATLALGAGAYRQAELMLALSVVATASLLVSLVPPA
jgi:putative copper export protein